MPALYRFPKWEVRAEEVLAEVQTGPCSSHVLFIVTLLSVPGKTGGDTLLPTVEESIV